MVLRLGELTVDIGADTSDLKRAGKEVKRTAGSMERSFKRVGSAIVAALSFQAVKSVALLADSMNMLDARIRNLTNSAKDFQIISAGIREIAKETGGAIQSIGSLTQNLLIAAESIGATSDEVVQMTSTLNKLGQIGGSSTEQMTNSMLQFGQAMSGGVVRAEEFNSIIENTPLIAREIAKGMGLNVGELRKMVITGKVLSEDVFKALQNRVVSVNKQFEKMPLTISRTAGIIKNVLTIAVQKLDKATGATVGFASVLNDLADEIIELIDDEEKFNDTLEVTKDIATALAIILVSRLGVAFSGVTKDIVKNSIASKAASTVNSKLITSNIVLAESTLATAKAEQALSSALATKARVSLVSLKASKDSAVQALINARRTERLTAAFVQQSTLELERARAITVATANSTIQVMVEKQLEEAKKASTRASKELAIAELAVSKSAKNVTSAKLKASLAVKSLTSAKKSSALASGQLSIANSAMTASTKNATFRAIALTKATNFLKGSLALLGGPIGIIFTVVTSLILFVDWTSKADKAAADAADSLDKQREAFKKLNEAQRDALSKDLSSQQITLIKKINEQAEVVRKLEAIQVELSKSTRAAGSGFSAMGAKVDVARDKLNDLQSELTETSNKLNALFETGLPDLTGDDSELKPIIILSEDKLDKEISRLMELIETYGLSTEALNLFNAEKLIELERSKLSKKATEEEIQAFKKRAKTILSLTKMLNEKIAIEKKKADDKELERERKKAEQLKAIQLRQEQDFATSLGTIFGLEKEAAIVSATLGLQSAIAKAFAQKGAFAFGDIAVITAQFANLFSTIKSLKGPGRQAGGNVSQGVLHPVNENGQPELLIQGSKQFLLSGQSGGQIIPATSMRSSGGGGGLNVTIHNNAADLVDVGEPFVTQGELIISISRAVSQAVDQVNTSLASGRGETFDSLTRGSSITRSI